MNNTKSEFNKRTSEIDKYFHFLEMLDKGQCSISCLPITGTATTEVIDIELIKILKANGFILLYNLIESVIRQSIVEIFSVVQSKNLTFQKISEKLKNLWISQHTFAFRKGTESINHDKIHKLLFSVANSIIDKEIMQIKANCFTISGNIDAEAIRYIARKIGFDTSLNGRELETIKEKRNHLAHGIFSFCEIGQDYSVQDLQRFKQNTYIHLTDVLGKMENYLTNKSYENVIV
jgi:hypothetical protein